MPGFTLKVPPKVENTQSFDNWTILTRLSELHLMALMTVGKLAKGYMDNLPLNVDMVVDGVTYNVSKCGWVKNIS